MSGNDHIAAIDTTGLVSGVAYGTAIITYTVVTSCGSAATIKTISVNPLPDAGMITGTGAICVGDTALMSNATADGVWSSGAATIISIGSSGKIAGNAAGVGLIYYTSANHCGTDIATKTVTVHPLPAVMTGPMRLCKGGITTLSDGSIGGTWSSSDPGTAPVNYLSGVVTGLNSGTTLITYTLTTGCFRTGAATVDPLPTIDTISGGGNYCSGGAGVHIYLNHSRYGYTYDLYHDTSPAGSLPGSGSTLDFGLRTNAGTYSAIATNTFGCTGYMYGNAVVSIISTVTPAVNISLTPGDTLCSGATATFTAVPTHGGAAPTYIWRLNGATIAAGNTYSCTPSNGDIISVRLTSNAQCPLPDSAVTTKAMIVFPNEQPVVAISADTNPVCTNDSAVFHAASVNGGMSPVYHWFKNNAMVATGTSYIYTPIDSDEVYALLNSNYRCPISNNVKSNTVSMRMVEALIPIVDITAEPKDNIVAGQTITFKAFVSSGGLTPTYQWLVNGIPIAGATDSTYASSQLQDNDSVTCVVNASGLCAYSGFNSIQIKLSTGVRQSSLAMSELTVIPNPNNGHFTVRTTRPGVFTVYTIDGREIQSNTVTRGSNSLSLPKNLVAGIYMCRFRDEDGIIQALRLLYEP
jgi:hypothetical protein